MSIDYCLKHAGVSINDINYIVFYDKPFLKFERLLETYLAFAPKGFRSFLMAIPLWLKEKLFHKVLLKDEFKKLGLENGIDAKLLFAEHHQSHAASAFFPSPFEEAVVLTLDGVGEWATSSVSIGVGNNLRLVKELHFPHSIGLLYSAFTYYLGFKVNSGEYKVMGLAPYGTPAYYTQIMDSLIDVKSDGSFRLDMKYFDYCTGLKMTNENFNHLFSSPPRKEGEPLTQFHMDIAASLQAVTEEVMLRITRSLAAETGIKNLCLAGGVALNCVANGRVLRDGSFDSIWIQPAAGDAGGAIGAAMAAYHQFLGRERIIDHCDGMSGGYLGPSFTDIEIQRQLLASGAIYRQLDENELLVEVASHLTAGKAVGWFQGRMEFGPRALGSRSILGDPRDPSMQKILNLKVKFRESFRPFAPAIIREDVSSWFDLDRDSPYMLFVADVAKDQIINTERNQSGLFGIDKLNEVRSKIPAVTHVDFSARVQTVHKKTNRKFYNLLHAFKKETGCPILINTSFNVRGEPIVCDPEDAFRCFMGTDIEVLVIENFILLKNDQDARLKTNYSSNFELD